MVGGHTRNKAFKEVRLEVPRSTRAKTNNEKRTKRNNHKSKGIREVTVPKQMPKTPQHAGVDAISSVSVQSETVCETNALSKSTEIKKLKETIKLMRKEME